MATEKQRAAAKRNVKKAQRRWRKMSSAERARALPDSDRQKPGASGVERATGQRDSGSWDTQKWPIAMDEAHTFRRRTIKKAREAQRSG